MKTFGPLSMIAFVRLTVSLLLITNRGVCLLFKNGNPYHHRETLDSRGKYILDWTVDWLQEKITFQVTVETKGYIGFGLSDSSKMSGADIVIGGMFPDGRTYFSDLHAVGSVMPEEDSHQDWKLLEIRENVTHTYIKFSRAFDTCDPQDYPISEDKVTIIWAYGESDEVIYHHQTRGSVDVHLLSPKYFPEVDSSQSSNSHDLNVWSIDSSLDLHTQGTLYWCTLYKAPELLSPHHIIGMNVEFADSVTRSRVRQIVIYKCQLPFSTSDQFSALLVYPGQQCLNMRAPTGPIPTNWCTAHVMTWGAGGKSIFLPPHVGMSFGTSPEEHYLIQVHYENTLQTTVAPVHVNFKVDIFYTNQLRPNEGGLLTVGHTIPGRTPSLLIPPSSINHKIHGICGSHCTREILPKLGIHIYGVQLHARRSAKRIKLRLFRQTREMPWIVSETNYNWKNQQVIMLSQERTVLPWDILVLSCEYDNTWTNGTIVGGYSSEQEMCTANILYYNKLPGFEECSSEIGSSYHRHRLLGVHNITWSGPQLEYLVDDKNSSIFGMKMSEVSDFHVDWNLKRRKDLEKWQLTSQHVNWCYREVYAGGPINTPETELIPPPRKRQPQPSRSIGTGRRKRRQLSPTAIPKYEPEWEDPRRYSHFPHNIKPYTPPKRKCSNDKLDL